MTLYHLYTIAGLILALAMVYRLFRCAHAWELVDKTELPPKIQSIPVGNQYFIADTVELTTRTVIIVIRCPKCGAAKVIREKG